MEYEPIMNELRLIIVKNAELMRKMLPYKSGNLANNAFKIEPTEDGFDLHIDLSIAPYAEWIDRPDYRSYQYWEKAVNEFIKLMEHDLKGRIE